MPRSWRAKVLKHNSPVVTLVSFHISFLCDVWCSHQHVWMVFQRDVCLHWVGVGFFSDTIKLLMVIHLIKPGTMVPTVIMRSRHPLPRTPQERSTHSCITGPIVQSQPHIGPKHVVIILL